MILTEKNFQAFKEYVGTAQVITSTHPYTPVPTGVDCHILLRPGDSFTSKIENGVEIIEVQRFA